MPRNSTLYKPSKEQARFVSQEQLATFATSYNKKRNAANTYTQEALSDAESMSDEGDQKAVAKLTMALDATEQQLILLQRMRDLLTPEQDDILPST